MEGNSITSFENLCRIFEMRIKLDKENKTKTSSDVFNNYEKYSKKIDSIYNNEFQKELKPLISPAITLEKEEDRLRRLVKLLEDRLDKRVELEDRYYDTTGKYISGLQMIVSESELNEKKERLALISNYLDTDKEINNVTDSLNKLRDLLIEEENKRDEYENKNKIMEDELYSTFINEIKNDDYYKDINEEDIEIELERIRSKISETKETLDITKESVGTLITSGLEDDYTSYVEEAEKNYYNYKNKEIILKIYKIVIKFEDDFKLICSKRESISRLLDEKRELCDSLSIDTEEELVSFDKVLLLQLKTLDNEKEVLENIANYNSRIKFKEERLAELNDINNSADILVILKEYGLVETYDACEMEDIEDNYENNDNSNSSVLEDSNTLDKISDVVYEPYRIVEIKDYPKSLNVGLAKLKGESVREKVNKKLNPKEVVGFGDLQLVLDEGSSDSNSDVEVSTIEEQQNNHNEVDVIKNDMPVWEIPTIEENNNVNDLSNNIPVWSSVEPVFDISKPIEDNEINNLNITSSEVNNNSDNNMFWVPVSDSKLETKDFPTINIPISDSFNGNGNLTFPTIKTQGD